MSVKFTFSSLRECSRCGPSEDIKLQIKANFSWWVKKKKLQNIQSSHVKIFSHILLRLSFWNMPSIWMHIWGGYLFSCRCLRRFDTLSAMRARYSCCAFKMNLIRLFLLSVKKETTKCRMSLWFFKGISRIKCYFNAEHRPPNIYCFLVAMSH